MLRNVFISEDIPREVRLFNSTFIEGMQMHRYYGYFIVIIALILLLFTVFKFKLIIPSLFLLCLAGFGYYTVYKINARVKERKEIFIKGNVVHAQVEKQGREFNLFNFKRDYTIFVNTGKDELIKIANKREGLWIDCPVGKEIIGLEYNNKYYFGEEMGCHFQLFEQ